MGSTTNIRKVPTTQPINAPNMGISAVNAISIPISIAYGKRNRVMDTKNMVPRITASRH